MRSVGDTNGAAHIRNVGVHLHPRPLGRGTWADGHSPPPDKPVKSLGRFGHRGIYLASPLLEEFSFTVMLPNLANPLEPKLFGIPVRVVRGRGSARGKVLEDEPLATLSVRGSRERTHVRPDPVTKKAHASTSRVSRTARMSSILASRLMSRGLSENPVPRGLNTMRRSSAASWFKKRIGWREPPRLSRGLTAVASRGECAVLPPLPGKRSRRSLRVRSEHRGCPPRECPMSSRETYTARRCSLPGEDFDPSSGIESSGGNVAQVRFLPGGSLARLAMRFWLRTVCQAGEQCRE